MAKSVVTSGLDARCLVQLSYAIGVAKPLPLFVDDVTNVLKIEFDCRPNAIAQSLALREPKYQETAAYCHFGRQPESKNCIKFLEGEKAKGLKKYSSMNTHQAALKSSNFLVSEFTVPRWTRDDVMKWLISENLSEFASCFKDAAELCRLTTFVCACYELGFTYFDHVLLVQVGMYVCMYECTYVCMYVRRISMYTTTLIYNIIMFMIVFLESSMLKSL